MLLNNELLSIDDILLEPKLGVLDSRKNAELRPFIFSAPMDTVTGVNLALEMIKQGETPVVSREFVGEALKDSTLREHAFFAVGASETDIQTFIDQAKPYSVNVAIDVAHGDSKIAYKAIFLLRATGVCRSIMSGSIATISAAVRCVAAGCTYLRVGIGPGSACTTRLQTGVGVPQLSAVYLISKGLSEIKNFDRSTIMVIADGGIRYSGDAVKYIAAGADAIMLGRAFSTTIESPGWQRTYTIVEPGKQGFSKLRKAYRGHASKEYQTKNNKFRSPEGVALPLIELDENITVQSVIEYYRDGMQSALSYLGLSDIKQLRPENISFLKITQNSYLEGLPHV